jgi:hypothetical protein
MAVALKDWLYIGSILLGFLIMIFRQGSFFGNMLEHQKEQDEKIDGVNVGLREVKEIISPGDSKKKLITLEWCDRQQTSCSSKRDLRIHALQGDIAEIKDMVKMVNGTLKIVGETLARLDERTGR